MKTNIFLFFGLLVFMFLFRWFPHPPNFTPVLALTLYGSIFFGIRSLPFIILSFAICDMFLGFHNLLIFTWGSLFLIGLLKIYCINFYTRVFGLFFSATIFYVVTNFGVWAFSSVYEGNLNGLMKCYILALPFFTNTLLSTVLSGLIIEIVLFVQKNKLFSRI